jgi:hypothetical protein
MTNEEILETANSMLKVKVSTLTKSKMNPANLSFGFGCSNGVTVLFGRVHTYVSYGGNLYKAV